MCFGVSTNKLDIMSFTRQYRQIMQPEKRVSRNNILPRNIYRISTYTGSKPVTMVNDDSRWVFVIGRVDDKIHCIRLNEIKPLDFLKWLNKVREKRTPIGKDNQLSLLLKKFSKQGKELWEQYIKNDPLVYKPGKSYYRIYTMSKIQNIWEIRFEENFLRETFGEKDEPNTEQEMRVEIKDELNEKDG
jgi:hypothetical protein